MAGGLTSCQVDEAERAFIRDHKGGTLRINWVEVSQAKNATPASPGPGAFYSRFACGSCPNTMSAAFDSEGETWGDMLEAFRGLGWKLEVDAFTARVVAATCPECVAKEKSE